MKVTLKIPRSSRGSDHSSSSSRFSSKHRRISKMLSSSTDSLHESDHVTKNMVKISVWVCGKIWKFGAIGHALLPLKLALDNNPTPIVAGLYRHTEVSNKIGKLR